MTKWKVTLKEKLQGQRQIIVLLKKLKKHDVKLLHQGKSATKHVYEYKNHIIQQSLNSAQFSSISEVQIWN